MRLATLALPVAMAMATPALAGTLFQDDFQTNTTGGNLTPSGWSLSSGQVDIVGPGYFPAICHGTTDICIDLDGSSGVVGSIRTAQSFSLISGASYTLSFDYTWNWFNDQNPNSMNFGVGGFASSLTTSDRRVQNSAAGSYTPLSFSFTGNGTTGAIFFQHLGASDLGGIVIDNVKLVETLSGGGGNTAPVPLPAGLPLLLVGLGGLAALRRRT